MKVYEFKVQLACVTPQLRELQLYNIIHSIDKQAPIPQSLEGGDGNGPLYLCVLDVEKIDELYKYCNENNHLIIYSTPHHFHLDETLYCSDYYVEWYFGSHPNVIKKIDSKPHTQIL